MNNFQTVIFDYDGTIADTLEAWLQYLRPFFQNRGFYNYSDYDFKNRLIGHFEPFDKPEIIATEEFQIGVMPHFLQYFYSINLNPHVRELLEKLKQAEKKVVVASTSYKGIINPILEKYELIELIDWVLGIEDVQFLKPDPELVNKVVVKFNIDKSQILLVGDTNVDLQTAKNAGVKSVLYYPPHNQNFYQLADPQVYQPDFIIEDFLQLLKIAG